jgi:hypothetical protein
MKGFLHFVPETAKLSRCSSFSVSHRMQLTYQVGWNFAINLKSILPFGHSHPVLKQSSSTPTVLRSARKDKSAQ